MTDAIRDRRLYIPGNSGTPQARVGPSVPVAQKARAGAIVLSSHQNSQGDKRRLASLRGADRIRKAVAAHTNLNQGRAIRLSFGSRHFDIDGDAQRPRCPKTEAPRLLRGASSFWLSGWLVSSRVVHPGARRPNIGAGVMRARCSALSIRRVAALTARAIIARGGSIRRIGLTTLGIVLRHRRRGTDDESGCCQECGCGKFPHLLLLACRPPQATCKQGMCS
jgi:hypothetical protein